MDLSNISKEDLRAELEDGTTVEVIPKGKGAIYVFRDPEGNEVFKKPSNLPHEIGTGTAIGREIKRHINPDLKTEVINRHFEATRQELIELYDCVVLLKEHEEREAQLRKEEELQQNLETARTLLTQHKHPLIHIASVVSWLTAGERLNIMYAFLAFASQAALSNPISVIAEGEGSSGKTHIQNVALKFIPDEFILNEKSVTESVVFKRGAEDPYFYDNKIVNYGDLGGKNDQEYIVQAKNLMKEMQTEGYINKPLNVPSPEGGWEVQNLELFGFPCLTYTTVPNYDFDDQELSRSIIITPRTDNRRVFQERSSLVELKGRIHHKIKYYEERAKELQYLIYAIRDRQKSGLNIVNPYNDLIVKVLGTSEYYKRDTPKFTGILRVITAFNGYTRPTFKTDYGEYLFTTKDDIQIFLSILKGYMNSISANISPKASEVLEELQDRMSEWIQDKKIDKSGITTNEYHSLSLSHLSKRSVQKYFSELNNAGILQVVGKKGRSNIYNLTEEYAFTAGPPKITLTERDKNRILTEHGREALEFIENDEMTPGLSIYTQDETIEIPPWEKYDKKQR